MSSDRSRRTDRARHGYTGIAAQQGRVILDRDFNALQGLMSDRREAETIDVIGPCGTPDDGLRISAPDPAGPPPHLYSPPFSEPASPPYTAGGPGDLLISPGTMYVGGQRVVFPARQDGVPISYSYFDQPDWPSPDVPAQQGGFAQPELVYLDVTEQEVSAVEDPDLLEVALGGPDTTQRLKLLRRVRRLPVTARDCTTAWQAAVAQWASQGLQFDPATMRLIPQARLLVGFTQDASSGDPCDPVATGGYLGSDNQLIRVRTVNDASGTGLIWGYDNASFLYRIVSVSADDTMLTLAADPPDGFHAPQTGQLVEVLRTAAVLGQEPDESDPSGAATILRVAAEPAGVLATLARPYGPVTPGDPTSYIVLTSALPVDVASSPLPIFLRVWQARLPLPAVGGTVTLADPATGISTGVTTTITLPTRTALPDGAFWQVAVRPATPQGVYPEGLLTKPQLPDGPRRWVCPLALHAIGFDKDVIIDCRNCFIDLVELTRRRPGCCTVGIRPSDVTAATPLQALIDKAATKGSYVTVCLAPGDYQLPQSLRLDTRHEYMTIEGCGPATALRADGAADPAQFLDGLVVVQSSHVTLRGLELYAPLAPNHVSTLPIYAGFGVRAYNAVRLTLEDCTITLVDTRAGVAADVCAAAVLLQGTCDGVKMRGCGLQSEIPPTFTPQLPPAPVAAAAFTNALDKLHRTLAPSSPPASTASLILERAQAFVETVRARRPTLAIAATVSPVIATIGVLAIESVGPVDCILGDSSFHGNRFTGLSVGAWIYAFATTLRVEDNVISGGVAGFWMETPNAQIQLPWPPGPDYYSQAVDFQEFGFASLLAPIIFPLSSPLTVSASNLARTASAPAGVVRRGETGSAASTPSVPAPGAIPSPPTSSEFTIFMLGNKFETIPPASAPAETWGCSAALMLVLSKQQSNVVVISANHLSAPSAPSAPTALIVLPFNVPCAITGNVVLNNGTIRPASLWVVAEGDVDGTQQLSITGNVLNGTSDLTLLPRLGRGEGGWDSYNANPT